MSATRIVAEPYTHEERDFIRAFASALSHATAVIAAQPEVAVSDGSIAQRIQKAYSRFRLNQQPVIQRRARERLAGPSEQRQRYFGAYADRGSGAWTDAEPGLGRELKRLLRDAVRARLDFQRQEVTESLAIGVAAEFHGGPLPLTKTTLEIGYFSGDVQAAWTSLTISSPIKVELRWETNAPGAERGVWQLFRFGLFGKRDVLLASGHAGNAPGSIFSIDLGKYLPPNPPALQSVYRVRVTPGTKPKIGQGRRPTAGKAVAPPSNDIIITYSAVATPGVEFEIFEIYQNLTFLLDSIHMIEDQIGGGSEEFYVAGFVQESLPAGSAQPGTQEKFGPYFKEIDPDGLRTKWLSHWSSFSLNKPDSPEWPRAYTVVISVMEEDDGGSLNEWESIIWEVAQEMMNGDVNQDIQDFLEEEFKDFVGDNFDEIIKSGGQIAQTVASLIGSATSAMVGTIVAAAGLVISDIISGMGDDYYGTEVSVFGLPTNITDFVESLPGQAIDGGYQLETDNLLFQGHTSWPEATAWDGMVEVLFHWEFSGKYQS